MNELLLYDQINPGDARAFVEHLATMRGHVTVRINSPGGAVSDGLAIYNALQRRGDVTVVIDGLAASIASMIAMAGHPVQIAENGLLMIHAPWMASAEGNAAELRQIADTLDAHAQAMVGAYASKSGKTREQVLQIMADETWFDAEQALAAGFVDSIIPALDAAASVRFDLSHFHHAPVEIFAMPQNTNANAPGQPNNHAPTTPNAEQVLAAERTRRTEIRAVFDRMLSYEGVRDLRDAVLDDMTCTLEQARTKLLDKLGEGSEPLGGNPLIEPGSNHHVGEFRAAAVDALLMRHGVPVAKPHPAVNDIRGMSLSDICGTMLAQGGRTMRGASKSDVIQAALTTSDLPNLLENVGNKSLMIGFREQEHATHRVWTREGSLPDFKPARRIALSEAPGLEQVPEAGEIHYGGLLDGKESIQLATYARILGISRQALINDDLGELTRIPLAQGQAAARKESDLVYALLTSNPLMRDGNPLFDALHNNLAAVGTALSVNSLGAARAAMRKQMGIGGEAFLNITPVFLIVPPELETIAEQLLTSITPAQPTNSVPDWVRRLTVVVDPRLSVASTTAWYLAASPSVHDTIEVARLNGEAPLSRTEEAFNTLELRFRVVMDMGAAAIDWRGMYQNPGA